MANSVDPDQTAPIGAVCSGSKLFASILNLSVMLGNYLQQTTTADNIFRCIFFLALQGLMNNIDQRKGGKVMTQFMVHVIMVMQIFFSSYFTK